MIIYLIRVWWLEVTLKGEKALPYFEKGYLENFLLLPISLRMFKKSKYGIILGEKGKAPVASWAVVSAKFVLESKVR